MQGSRGSLHASEKADISPLSQTADSQAASRVSLGTHASERGLTTHEANRAKKAIDRNRLAIENRIKFFQKEEEKIWRDLEEVRRQAATIEEGRSRTIEKKLADRAIQQEKELVVQQNRARASHNKSTISDLRKRQQFELMRDKQMQASAQRESSQAILRQKRLTDMEERRVNAERAAHIQITQKDARARASQDRAIRIDRMRETQEMERQMAEQEVFDAEGSLPELEEQEMICLQRLQNSRIVTQSVLEELETRLGSRSSVTSLLRSKQRGQEHLDASLGFNAEGQQLMEDGNAFAVNGMDGGGGGGPASGTDMMGEPPHT